MIHVPSAPKGPIRPKTSLWPEATRLWKVRTPLPDRLLVTFSEPTVSKGMLMKTSSFSHHSVARITIRTTEMGRWLSGFSSNISPLNGRKTFGCYKKKTMDMPIYGSGERGGTTDTRVMDEDGRQTDVSQQWTWKTRLQAISLDLRRSDPDSLFWTRNSS